MAGTYGGASSGGKAYVPVVAQSTFGAAFPALVITEIAFASNPLDDPAVWTDVSLYTESIQTNRGRQHELGRFEAGTATVVLDNTDGRFSPFNTSSAYNPNVVPYKQLRVRALYNGVYYPIFRGHIEAWPVKWPGPADSTVTVRAADATKVLNIKKATSVSTYSKVVLADTPTVYYRLGDTPGSATAVDASGNGNSGQIFGLNASPPGFLGAPSRLVGETTTAFDCGNKNSNGALVTNGYIRCPSNILLTSTADWTLATWISARTAASDFIAYAGNGAQYMYFRIQADGSLRGTVSDGTNIVDITTTSRLTGQTAYVALTWQASSRNLRITINGQQDVAGVAGSGPVYSVGGTGSNAVTFGPFDGVIDEAAVWVTKDLLALGTLSGHYLAGAAPLSGQTSGARIGSVLDAVGWPGSLRKIDSGLVAVQPATNDVVNNTALANIQVTADTELGELFIDAAGNVSFFDHAHKYKSPNDITALMLGDSGTTGPGGESPYLLGSVDIAFDDLDVYNEAVVTPAGLGSQTASDTTSQTSYGKRTTSRGGVHLNANDALNEANWLVGKYKSPLQRIRQITFQPMSDPTVLLPAALGFELLTRVTVKRRPKDGAGSTFTQDSLVEGIEHTVTQGAWQTTWRLSPTDASPLMGIFNQSTFNNAVFGF